MYGICLAVDDDTSNAQQNKLPGAARDLIKDGWAAVAKKLTSSEVDLIWRWVQVNTRGPRSRPLSSMKLSRGVWAGVYGVVKHEDEKGNIQIEILIGSKDVSFWVGS